MRYFETHAHYDDDKFKEDVDEVIKSVRKANVDKIVNVACDFSTCISSMELSRKYEDIYFTFGVHPYSADEFDIKILNKIYDECNIKDKLVAIGEIGLDYSYDNIDKDKQKDIFIKQIKFAQSKNLPIIVHTRDASNDTAKILREYTNDSNKVLLHCFCPTDDMVNLVMQRDNVYISLGGNITFKRKDSFEKYIQRIPIEKIMLETDSPYLAPVPKRGQRNDSSNIILICAKLAEIKNMKEDEVAEITYKNSCNFYNINE